MGPLEVEGRGVNDMGPLEVEGRGVNDMGPLEVEGRGVRHGGEGKGRADMVGKGQPK
jgi:hypothetical protein